MAFPPKRLQRVFWLLFWPAAFAVSTAAQTPKLPAKPEETPPPNSIVKGRVVYDDTGYPVRRSPVTLTALPERGRLSSATDRDGRFAIGNVPPGVYFVAVDSPGVITPYAFIKLKENGPESFDLKAIKEYCTEIVVDGTSNLNITVRARRGGAISGKITYGDGSPAVNAAIGVLVRKGNQTIRVLTGVNAVALLSLHTDDRGRYRVSGLPPGEYLVTASEKNSAPGQSDRDDLFGGLFSNDALSVSYYGNSTKMSDAVAVKVELGSELNNIDITLADSTPHTISGSVIGRGTGRALAGATLKIRNKEQGDAIMRGERRAGTDSEGQWSIYDVPDGTYVISVEPPYDQSGDEKPTDDSDNENEKKPSRPKRRFVPKEIEAAVNGSDVVGLAIELVEGGSVSGTVEFTSATVEEPYIAVRYSYEGELLEGYRPFEEVMVTDRTFVIEPVRPGKLYIQAYANTMGASRNAPAQYFVKSITHNGADLTQKPLVVEAGQIVTNVKIVLSSELAKASVQLVDAQGKPLPAKRMMIVSINPSTWSFTNEQSNQVSDANGVVKYQGSPGEYLMLVAGPDESWPPSIDAIRLRSATAPRIKLSSGDNKTIRLTIEK